MHRSSRSRAPSDDRTDGAGAHSSARTECAETPDRRRLTDPYRRAAVSFERRRILKHPKFVYAAIEMLTEAVLNEIVKSVVGSGFSHVVRTVFARSSGLSESQILNQLLGELRRHGAQIDDLDLRLTRLERVTDSLIGRVSTPQFAVASGRNGPTSLAAKLYCNRCGMIPGPASPKKECNYPYQSHSWVDLENVYCRRCGAVPGQSSTCTGPLAGHSWLDMEPVFCSTCGLTPGKRTECGVVGHNWKRLPA